MYVGSVCDGVWEEVACGGHVSLGIVRAWASIFLFAIFEEKKMILISLRYTIKKTFSSIILLSTSFS